MLGDSHREGFALCTYRIQSLAGASKRQIVSNYIASGSQLPVREAVHPGRVLIQLMPMLKRDHLRLKSDYCS
jgi:hypothetical protein